MADLSRLARRLLRVIPADGGRLNALAQAAGLPLTDAPKAAVELYRAGLLANVAPVTLNAEGWQRKRQLEEAA